MTEAGRRFGLKGISFGDLFPNSSPEPPTPVRRRHSWRLHRIEEVGFLEVSVALESSGKEGGIGFSPLFACPQPPKLPAPTRGPADPPSQVLPLRATGECALLHFAFGCHLAPRDPPLGASESPFLKLGGPHPPRSTNFRDSGQAMAWGSPDFPSPEGPAGYLWEFILSANL